MYHSIALKEYAKTKYIWEPLKTASLSACSEINNPDASVGVLNLPHESKRLMRDIGDGN